MAEYSYNDSWLDFPGEGLLFWRINVGIQVAAAIRIPPKSLLCLCLTRRLHPRHLHHSNRANHWSNRFPCAIGELGSRCRSHLF